MVLNSLSHHDAHIVPFLDLIITGNPIISGVDTFRKETAGNTTLYASSSHPPNTVKAILIGEFTRAKIKLLSASFQEQTNNIFTRLKQW